MNKRIIAIDCVAQHRRVLRHFMKKTFPDIELVEYTPETHGKPPNNFQWSDYDLLVIDNRLDAQDGYEWVEEFQGYPGFPPWIVLSSQDEENASRDVIKGIKMGAVDFLFKKGMSARQLHEAIYGILVKAGYDRKVPLRNRPEIASAKKAVTSSGKYVAMNIDDTQQEMQLAMAMLHGEENWPFSMEEILAGEAHIGEYRIRSYRGHGRNVTDFLCKSPQIKGDLVLRLVNQLLMNDKNLVRKLRKEFENILEWNHPHLAAYLDFQIDNGLMYVIKEQITGDTLTQEISRDRTGENEAVSYLLQLLDALKFMHQHDVFAGSYSPDDIRLPKKDSLILMEYGLIHRPHATTQLTSEQQAKIAKPFYMTPESIQNRQPDARSDLYIAGIIFYEMLVGQPPFHKGSIQDILYAHITRPVPELNGKLAVYNRLLQEMLHKTPSKRIQTADQIIGMIQRIRS